MGGPPVLILIGLYLVISYKLVRLIPPRWGNYSPNAKANFQFQRVVKGWRGIRVLELRLKK